MPNKDTDIFFLVIGATIVLLILLCVIVSFLFLYKKRQHRYRLEMKNVKEHYDQEILKTQLEIREQTLRNISEELHDNFGQMLSLSILNLSAIDFADEPAATAKVETITVLIKKVISDLRSLSKSLDPASLARAGLAASVQYELGMLEKTGLFAVAFSAAGKERRLEPAREIVVYRVLQEALNNVIKHSQAKNIRVSLCYQEEALAIEIIDDGRGFDTNEQARQDPGVKGSGLQNMKRRMGLIQAKLEIRTLPSRGTTLLLAIPFTPLEQNNPNGGSRKDKNSDHR